MMADRCYAEVPARMAERQLRGPLGGKRTLPTRNEVLRWLLAQQLAGSGPPPARPTAPGFTGHRAMGLARQAAALARPEPSEAPEIVNFVLRSPGRQLDPAVRKAMEAHFTHQLPGMPIFPRPAALAGHIAVGPAGDASEREADRLGDAFGRPLQGNAASIQASQPRFDFGTVQVHTDPVAAASARAIDAMAYTSGNHVVFARGQYAPHSPQGRQLIAHELTHVIQQGGAQPRV